MEGNFLKMPDGQEGNRIVRKTNDLSQKKFENLKKDLEDREIRDGQERYKDFLSKYELKKTPQQQEILNFVIEETNKFLENFSKRNARTSIDLIRLVNEKFFKNIFPNMSPLGVSLERNQCVVVLADNNISKTALAETTFHELMHLFGFGRMSIKSGDRDGYANIALERIGLSVVSKEDENKLFFNAINEAVTVELTNRFHGAMKKSPLFQDEIWILKNIYQGGENFPPVLYEYVDENNETKTSARVAYPGEHEKTMKMFYHIYEKNRETFSSSEDVFQMFAEAYFSGKLLPIARIMEKTYGKGGFRGIGEESSFSF